MHYFYSTLDALNNPDTVQIRGGTFSKEGRFDNYRFILDAINVRTNLRTVNCKITKLEVWLENIMIIVTFDSLIKQIKEKISGICSNIGTIRPLPTEYTSTGKVIRKTIIKDKLYSEF